MPNPRWLREPGGLRPRAPAERHPYPAHGHKSKPQRIADTQPIASSKVDESQAAAATPPPVPIAATTPAAMPAPASTAPVQAKPPPIVSLSPSSPAYLDILKAQAVNAKEWALTSLDEAVPNDIRQNLTLLRDEDLVDEGKSKPRTPICAYSAA